MLPQRLLAQAIQWCDLRLAQRRIIPNATGLIPHLLRRFLFALDLALFAQRVPPLALQYVDSRLRLYELLLQGVQDVRCGLELRVFLGECGNLADQAHPVDVRKVRVFPQLVECIQPFLLFLAFPLNGAEVLSQHAHAVFQVLPLRVQGVQLVGIAPAEDVAAAVVNAMAVVLLMAATGVFDLAGLRDGADLTMELFHGVTADDVAAPLKFLLQPRVVW